MNHQRDQDSEPAVDKDVRDAYRRLSKNSTPDSLNVKVLRLARRSVNDGEYSPTPRSWFHPLAFAAMVVLSLTVIIQFRDMGTVERLPESVTGADHEPSPHASQGAGDLAAAVETTGQRLRKLNSEAESLSSNNQPEPALVQGSGVFPGQVDDPVASSSEHCKAEAGTSAISWWRCIEELQRNGMDDAARGELELFKAAHPLFSTN